MKFLSLDNIKQTFCSSDFFGRTYWHWPQFIYKNMVLGSPQFINDIFSFSGYSHLSSSSSMPPSQIHGQTHLLIFLCIFHALYWELSIVHKHVPKNIKKLYIRSNSLTWFFRVTFKAPFFVFDRTKLASQIWKVWNKWAWRKICCLGAQTIDYHEKEHQRKREKKKVTWIKNQKIASNESVIS